MILDPFGGIGTTAKAAIVNERRFAIFEKEEEYIKLIEKNLSQASNGQDLDVNWIYTHQND